MDALDEVFDLLSRERRRFALYYLDRQQGPIEIDELARAIEEWESGSGPADAPDRGDGDVVITLEHDALPKMEAADFIEFDREANEVRITETTSAFRVILSVSEAIERPTDDPDAVRIEEFV